MAYQKTKEDVFYELLSMYEQSEKSVNRMISGDDAKLENYGLKKIELVLKQLAKEYQEAEA